MELQHFIAKIPVEGPLGIDPARVVDIFHAWVATQSVPGVLLVDVAELLHVPKGPGVIAVGHEADYALDNTGGVWGVLYRRKTVLDGSNAERIAQALGAALQGAAWLEEALGDGFKVSRSDFDLIVNDRALAPNTPESYAEAIPLIEAALRSALGHGDFSVTRHDRDPRGRLGVTVKSARPLNGAFRRD
jgi:hypothetical protein